MTRHLRTLSGSGTPKSAWARWRERHGVRVRWLLAATAAHGLIVAFLWLFPADRAPAALRGSVPHAEIGIETKTEPTQAPAAEARESSPPVLERNELERRDVENARPTTHPHAPGRSALPAPVEAAPEPEAHAPQDAAQPPSLSAEALGLAGRNIFLGRLPSTPELRQSPEPPPDNQAPGIDKSVREAMVEDDLRRGLSASGGVVSVTEQLVRTSDTPVNSVARLDITVDGAGSVRAVVVTAASEGFSAWERLAAALHKALRGRTIRVPQGAAGLAIGLEAISREQLPSGHDADTEVSLFGVPVKKATAHSNNPNRVNLLKPEASTVDVVQPPELHPPIKFPQKQRASSVSNGFAFDPVDLARHGHRVVHVRVVREKAL